ncbi:hypothetical protein [Microvirga sp. G4-2]|uniref:hypothetical protein n=1 Tax=Microvirga sp. G4-2 TaxID=3434467 RepID=UPI0040444608
MNLVAEPLDYSPSLDWASLFTCQPDRLGSSVNLVAKSRVPQPEDERPCRGPGTPMHSATPSGSGSSLEIGDQCSGLGGFAPDLASRLDPLQVFLLPVIWSDWHKPVMRVVALLLLVPVPFVIDQLAKPRWIQLTTGSVYGWTMVLCLLVLIDHEWRGRRMASHETLALPRLRGVATPP